jgi:hypothetical protein
MKVRGRALRRDRNQRVKGAVHHHVKPQAHRFIPLDDVPEVALTYRCAGGLKER